MSLLDVDILLDNAGFDILDIIRFTDYMGNKYSINWVQDIGTLIDMTKMHDSDYIIPICVDLAGNEFTDMLIYLVYHYKED